MVCQNNAHLVHGDTRRTIFLVEPPGVLNTGKQTTLVSKRAQSLTKPRAKLARSRAKLAKSGIKRCIIACKTLQKLRRLMHCKKTW